MQCNVIGVPHRVNTAQYILPHRNYPIAVAGRFSYRLMRMSKIILRYVYSMQMYNLWPIFTVCVARMRMVFERHMRSTTIIYFDVDMRMVLSVQNLHWTHLNSLSLYLFDLPMLNLYLFGLCLLWISVHKQCIDW